VSAWGWNEIGQLGDGTTTNGNVPVPVSGLGEVAGIAAGEQHSLALLRTGGLPGPLELVPGVGSLTVSWKAERGNRPLVRELAAGGAPAGQLQHRDKPSARDAQLHDLGAESRAVRSPRGQQNPSGRKVITGTPLP